MPKIVDWEGRRDEVLAATWRVIAREGLAGATIRKIAAEAGFSSGILGHYFEDKNEILASALRLSHRRVGARMAEVTVGLRGLEALRVVMLEALPLDDQRLLEAQIEVSFWGRLLGNADLQEVQRSEFDNFWAVLKAWVEQAVALGEIVPGLDPDEITHELMVLVDGVSVERVLYPQRVPPERQEKLLDVLLERIRAR